MKRRTLRAAMWLSLTAAAALAAALWTSLVHPLWIGTGRAVGGVSSGRIEFARSSGALTRQSIAWGLSSPYGYASILTAPTSAWRPSMASANVFSGQVAGPTTVQTLWVLYIPLWPWLIFACLSALILWRLAGRRPMPGHCPGCDYDLSGLAQSKCPECGHLLPFATARRPIPAS